MEWMREELIVVMPDRGSIRREAESGLLRDLGTWMNGQLREVSALLMNFLNHVLGET